jgi:tyrosine-specific transport protein
MVLAAFGLVPTLFLVAATWWIMYRSALVNLELVLQSGKCLDIGALGRLYGGPSTSIFGEVVLLALMYSLMGAYFYGFASLLCQVFSIGHSFHGTIAIALAVSFIFLMLLPMRWLDSVNRVVFGAMLLAGAILIVRLCGAARFHWDVMFPSGGHGGLWLAAIPVLFTSFGFQVIFAAMAEYCSMDEDALRRAFFWGSFITALVYCVWTWSTLLAIRGHSGEFFAALAAGSVDVGSFVSELSTIGGGGSSVSLVWAISVSAIGTSIIGVGMGLCNSLGRHLRWEGAGNSLRRRISIASAAAIPSAVLAIVIPKAFTAVLGFAGVILAILAIFIPVYLLRRCGPAKVFYGPVGERKNSIFLLAGGAVVVCCELLHICL